MKFLQKVKKFSLATIVISAVLGIVFIIFPAQVMTYLSLFLGVAMILLGAAAVINFLVDRSSAFTLVLGILSAILGIIVCTQYKAIISIMVIVLGIFILAAGIANFFTAIKIIASSLIFGWLTLGLSIATSVLGIVAITQSGSFSEALVQLIGAALIVYAVLDIVAYFQVKKLASDVRDSVEVAMDTDDIETTGSIVSETDD
ncbi:MAG: hypothetical protein E7520_05370 [Ruminococcaceae bacterium]|nr:hypothetical protein [Oscillospiraceae bacterium]